MPLLEKINSDMVVAMKAKDQARLRGIRAIKAAILLANTDGSGKTLDEVGEVALLQRLLKQRKDSFEVFSTQNRPDLAEKEKEEIEVIEAYLPAQMSPEALRESLRSIIERVGATSAKDMGKVMGVASKELAGKAEGKLISEAVKELLQ